MPRTSALTHLACLAVMAACLPLLSVAPCSAATVAELLDRAAEAEAANRYRVAESLYVEAIGLLEGAAKNPQQLVEVYVDLAAVRIRLCRYDAAQEAYDQALLEANTGSDVAEETTAGVLNGLARIEHIRGNYGKSERMFRRVLSMLDSESAVHSTALADAYCGLSDVCRSERRFADGQNYARKALKSLARNSDSDAERLALSNVCLGFNLRGEGQYDSALALYLRADSIVIRGLGPAHPLRASIYNHRSQLNNNLYKSDSAIHNANHAIAIVEPAFGRYHYECGMAQFNIARAYTLKALPEQALPHYDSAISILEPLLGPQHPLIGQVEGFLSFCYRYMDRFDEAMALADKITRSGVENFIANSEHLDDRSSVEYASNIYYSFSGYPAYFFDSPRVTDSQRRNLAQLAISAKGIVDDVLYSRQRAIEQSPDSLVRLMYDEVLGIRAEFSSLQFTDPLNSEPLSEQRKDSLRTRELELLGQIAERQSTLKPTNIEPFVRVEDICALIPENTCLIEYYGFHYVAPTTRNVEGTAFGAIVLDRNGVRGHRYVGEANPNFIPMHNEYHALLEERSTRTDWDPRARARFDDLCRQIYEIMWVPISDLVKDGEFVMIASDDYMSETSFGAIIAPDGSYLAEKHALHYVRSSRDLLRLKNPVTMGDGLFALYDPDFDASVEKRLAAMDEDPLWAGSAVSAPHAIRNIRPVCDKLNDLRLPRLSNTRPEIQSAIRNWNAGTSEPVRWFDGARATEDAVKRAAPGNRVLHIATHGYFIERDCRPGHPISGLLDAEPMLYSGLLLSGANLVGRSVDQGRVEDGVLTANEVRGLNLSGTNLVVLSACESARGDIATGQSAIGLSRAFLMAGARQVVSALWPVSDAASIEVMEKIYSSPDKPIAVALQEFAIEKIRADRAADRTPDPYYWAPYISYGDWRAR